MGNPVAIVAIGGNSLIKDKQHEDVQSQIQGGRRDLQAHRRYDRARLECDRHPWQRPAGRFYFAPQSSWPLPKVHSTPLDVIGADTQGSIGYMIARALDNEFTRREIKRSSPQSSPRCWSTAMIPASRTPPRASAVLPTKDKADVFAKEGWTVKEDAGRGWRRMIASPIPLKIVELDAIKSLINAGFIVVAVGGGGIPVIEDENGMLQGTYAVIDKDRASSLLAAELKADLFLISTAVEKVAINFNKPDQKWLDKMTLSEAKEALG